MGEHLEIHGPMWQYECHTCHYMGDCWETEAEALADMRNHDCFVHVPDWVRNVIERLRAENDDLQVLLRGRTAELQDEVKRLRAAGDALAEAVDDTWWPAYPCDFPDLLAAWQEARRG